MKTICNISRFIGEIFVFVGKFGLFVYFVLRMYNPQNQKSRFQKRKIKKNGKRFVDSLYSLIDLKTI